MTPAQFLEVADFFPEASLLVTGEGTILAANRAAGSLGYSAGALTGRALTDFTATPADAVREYLRLCARSREPLIGSLDLLGDEGRKVCCRCYGASVPRDAQGRGGQVLLRLLGKESAPSHFSVLSRKVDELTGEIRRRKQVEERLHDQGEWLRVTLSSIGDGVITTDGVARVTFLNPVAEALTGWRAEDAIGRPLTDVFAVIDEETRKPVEDPACRILAEGAVAGLAGSTVLLSRDGTETPVDHSGAPIRSDQGHVAGVVIVFRDVTKRRQWDEARRESEQRFRGLMEQAPFSAQVLATDGRTVRVNRAWEELWGVTLEQIGDYNILEDPQLEAKGVLPFLRKAFAGEAVRIPAIRYDPNETLPDLTRPRDAGRWVTAVAYPLKDTSGRVREVVLVHDDITPRKKAEEALQESEEKFRLMADTIPQLAWMARPDGHIFWYNRPWYDYTGTTPQQMEGWGWQSVHDPDVLPSVVERWRRSIESGEPFDMVFPLRGADGLFRPFLTRVNPLRGDGGGILFWFGTNTDISEQKRAEDASRFLADSSASLATVVDYQSTLQKVARLAVPQFGDWCAVDMVEADGSLRRLAVAHVDPEKVRLAHELDRRYPPDPDAPVGAAHVARTGEAEMSEDIPDSLLEATARDEEHLRILRELGLKSYLSVPMKVRGKVLGVLTFVSAESRRRYGPADLALAEELAGRASVAVENSRLYAELREADRRKDEFLATLAHELRNPLAPIRNSLEILKIPAVDRGVIERSRETMERQVQHLVRLVDDLLDVSRVMRGRIELRRERLDLATVIAHAVETARPVIDAQGHELILSLPPHSLEAEADPVRLTQVVGNLLTNAAKYTPRGGRIGLTATREGDRAVVEVRDDGIGIAPEMLSGIFDLFVQVDNSVARSQGGLGIGLTLVRSLVEMHGGEVEARSAGLGQGSAFVVKLPLAPPRSRRASGTPESIDTRAEPAGSDRRVLVVDDNVDAAETLAMLLQLGGSDVKVAHDGPTALQLAQESRPDIAFLDLGMPMMDGYELAGRLRRIPALEAIVLVALTGWGQEEDRRRTAQAGFDLHLVKPVEPSSLEKAMAHPRLRRPPG